MFRQVRSRFAAHIEVARPCRTQQSKQNSLFTPILLIIYNEPNSHNQN